MARPARETRANFEGGKVDAWSAGEYGHRVRVFAEKGKLKIRYQHPETGRPKQRTLFAAVSRELRKKAARVAVAKAEELRSGQTQAAEADQTPKRAAELTVEDVAHLYMKRAPGFPRRLLTGKKSDVVEWYESLPEKVRKLDSVPAVTTLVRDVYGWRHLFADDRFRPDRLIAEIDAADATTYAQDVVSRGVSPRTAANDLDRLSTAFNFLRVQHRSLGLSYNPIEGRIVDREKADIPAYEKEEGTRMWAAAPELAETGQWQVFVAVGIATSGRRLGSILALTEADHDFEAGRVVWEAHHAKGEGYGRGDEERPMTPLHRKAALWAIKNWPNPKGADAPLIWRTGGKTRETLPEQSVPQATIYSQLMRLEALADVEHQPGRAWHSFRRWAATFLADMLGDGPASEFVGMTIETLRRYNYKKVMPETMQKAADAFEGAFEEDES